MTREEIKMKSILLSIKPEWLAKILNGEKTIEVRKKFPKDYVGWVYLYCSKMKDKKHGTDQLLCDFKADKEDKYFVGGNWGNHNANDIEMPNHNGKVVARFWCDKVEKVGRWNVFEYGTETITPDNFNSMTCLRDDQIREYLGNSKTLFSIHISKLEIFDEPRKLKYFHYYKTFHRSEPDEEGRKTFKALIQLNKAPQNYCYVEEE